MAFEVAVKVKVGVVFGVVFGVGVVFEVEIEVEIELEGRRWPWHPLRHGATTTGDHGGRSFSMKTNPWRLALPAVAAVLAGVLASCGHPPPANMNPAPEAGQPDSGKDAGPPFKGRPGDLGANNPIIDHSGAGGGWRGKIQHGLVGSSWDPTTCTGSVPVAKGVSGAEWGEEVYGTTDRSPHGVHTSWRFATDSSISVIWETDKATLATTLAYGTAPDKLDQFVQGVTFINPDDLYGSVLYPLRAHEAHVCGLSPDTTYYFAVGGDGWYGNVYSVRTGPAVGNSSSFRFAVVGDSNAFYWLFQRVATKMATYAPDWLLFTGDLVNSGFSQWEWEQWFAAADPLVAHVPTMTVHGNHEDMATGYFALFAMPGNEEYYSFDYGNAHVVVLNDSPPPDEPITGKQAAFLDADLAAAQGRPNPPKWYITSHHRPMFSSDNGEGSNLSVRAAWQPIYEKRHTDVDFNGHNHHFEMTAPVLGDAVATTGGIRYVTSAGGGALFDAPTPVNNPWSIAYYAGLSFAIVDVDDSALTVTGYRTDGTVIHTFTTTK